MEEIKVITKPYIYENAFKSDNGDLINYSRLCVDVKIGDTTCRLTKKLTGFEVPYIKSLIEKQNHDDFLAN